MSFLTYFVFILLSNYVNANPISTMSSGSSQTCGCSSESTTVNKAPTNSFYQNVSTMNTDVFSFSLHEAVGYYLLTGTMFALLVVYAILRKPLPRIADPIPIEALTWAHSLDLLLWVDKDSNQINIRNHGCTDLDLTYCTISAESSNEEDRPEEYTFPEGYRLAANSVVSIVCGSGASLVYVPEKLVAQLDSRTCPRLAWVSFSTTNFLCDSASLFDASANCIVCDSTVPSSQTMSMDNSNDDESDPSDN